MQFQLKPISRDAIPEALEKVERYRLLNEPWQAESICEDILRIDEENQDALRGLLLALTDQFEAGVAASRAKTVVGRLRSEYDRAYYAGIVHERSGHWQLRQATRGSDYSAFECFQQAMKLYERAEQLRPPGNDDSILRWNTCARLLMRNKALKPRPEEIFEPVIGE